MGFCEIAETSRDLSEKTFNHYKFVCEISPNILFQYVLIMLWFLIVLSITVSIIGFIINLVGHLVTVTCFLSDGNPAREIYQILTLRECEYLEMIRRRNIPLFGDIVRKLQKERSECSCKGSFDVFTEKRHLHREEEVPSLDRTGLVYHERTHSYACDNK